MQVQGKNTGKGSTFGRGLMTFISQRLPYGYKELNDIQERNPKYEIFQRNGARRAEALANNSVAINDGSGPVPAGVFDSFNNLTRVLYANVNEDKSGRLRDYRVIAAYSDVADALDEICDEFVNKDENGDIVKLELRQKSLSDDHQKKLNEEFQKIVEYLDLENKGWSYIRQFLVEGELFFENIIHKDYVDKGILGFVNIPPELCDPVYNNIQNLMVKGFIYKKPVFDPKEPTKVERYDLVPMDENQIVYISSGIYDESKTFVLPILENARRSYRQLSLIEDAIVIYRLVRAPERLVFNVDVGNMPPPKAEAYLRKLIQNYWSSKTFDVDQNDVVQKFSPQSMLDAFWFAKRQGSEGTDVKQLPGGQNLGELNDLMYFIKKLYRSLKVPTSRLDPQDAFRDGNEILREELKFARFIIRMQQRFSYGIKKAFVTHLKLTKLWDEMELKELNLSVEFNPPTNFYDLRENQKLELKVTNFNNLTQNDSISKTFSQKKYLGWTDTQILANREYLRKDAEFRWEIQQIEANGPNWKESLQTGGAAPAAGGGEFGGGGGGGAPPAFGGGPAAVGETPPEAAPAEGEAPEGGATPPEAPAPAA
jgi:hypothetical protein